ncbi:MAG: winged helix-turn-helix domain-containing protein [Candidatus Hermodarchaeota archaeon]|nr:winged helix-turn-helix domain-containing protein [Candidatus Hermodarchaeota archaeon]
MTSSINDDVLVIPLASEERKKIAKALSNETTVTILQELAQQPRSATELAEYLTLPLTTVKYSIDALMDAKLIRIASVSLSPKRREVKIYTAVQRAIVFAPEKTSPTAVRLIRRLLPYFVVLLVSLPLAFVLRDLVYYFVRDAHEITLTPAAAAFFAFLAGSGFAIISLLLLKASWMLFKSMKSQR